MRAERKTQSPSQNIKTLLVLALAALSTQAVAQEVLRVHNWADYIDPAVVQDFERETGIRVDYSTYTTAAQLEADLDSGERFDVIVPSDLQLERLIKENRLARSTSASCRIAKRSVANCCSGSTPESMRICTPSRTCGARSAWSSMSVRHPAHCRLLYPTAGASCSSRPMPTS